MNKTSRDYARERADEIIRAIQTANYRPFLAESGTYGFYTDAEGTRIVSFECHAMSESVSGNYVTNEPHKCGQGWRIADSFRPDMVDEYFRMFAPRWAVGDAEWRHKTLKEHQAQYQDSSRYREVKEGDND